ncbi:Tetratricopeptide repeat-containing protein [Roseovarius nanhaiticus]|uniref:Tetratricopeptide repeat-containing protein n=1 Tax=Roseovarius nanhaiticus TaxID=573024 RepID=A0A1N7H784_9RHOB|nr:tetratricopeptide repeat protein [Roseovarius nanhaiticus]SEL10469.1 Tetratricopeptide repeat-containing protein [Roseovarius nanhaiticus]SIS20709.1 Tetratricopeptide repeat-containing protein [Roseovarius nanhaiticus]
MDLRLQLAKIKSPVYAYWQRIYYQAVKQEDFHTALKALKRISDKHKGMMPPYWALELAKVRLSLGQFDRAENVVEEIAESIKNSKTYNHDTKLFLLKHIERTHSAALKGKHGVADLLKAEGVQYIRVEEIDFTRVDPILSVGWPLIPE